MSTPRHTPLTAGEPAPWFHCRTGRRARFAFDTVAGRHIVLCFFGSAGEPRAARYLEGIGAMRGRFDDESLAFFGVSTDPADEAQGHIADAVSGIRYFRDFDREVSRAYGALDAAASYRPITYVLDPALRVLAALPFTGSPETDLATLRTVLDKLPTAAPPAPAAPHAPVLVVPRVFERELCRRLVAYYEARGGRPSGFMRDVEGRTVELSDPAHKRRRDCVVEDRALVRACRLRIHARLVPEIAKAFQFKATRIERDIVACYDAADAGHFRAHRDNTTLGTAHRRFAVSLFLNTGAYEGGYLRFPEYGSALYGAPVGGAVVFSCSLLHEATPVARGRRYMFLPFLYDDAAARVREENRRFLQDDRAVSSRPASSPDRAAAA